MTADSCMIKNLKNLAIGFLLCATIRTIANSFPQAIFKEILFINDTVNENLPFYKEVGRLVLNGEWPLQDCLDFRSLCCPNPIPVFLIAGWNTVPTFSQNQAVFHYP
jgi:hypothetical protein